jgi:hypothetical protein
VERAVAVSAVVDPVVGVSVEAGRAATVSAAAGRAVADPAAVGRAVGRVETRRAAGVRAGPTTDGRAPTA